MKVTIDAPCGDQTLTVELDSTDGAKLFPDWEELNSDKQFDKLSAVADILILYYLHQRHQITKDLMLDRMTVLKDRLK